MWNSTWLKLTRTGLKIKYVLEKHLHADFVSGHRELAERTEPRLSLPKSGCEVPTLRRKGGDELTVGNVTLRIRKRRAIRPKYFGMVIDQNARPTAPLRAEAAESADWRHALLCDGGAP